MHKYLLTDPELSILLAVFTDSPMRQYRGILIPTIPATTGPVWIPGNTGLILYKKLAANSLIFTSQIEEHIYHLYLSYDERTVNYGCDSKCINDSQAKIRNTPDEEINSLWPSDVVYRQCSQSALGQVMDWRLFIAEPLPEPVLTCQLEYWETTSVQFERMKIYFQRWKCTWKCHLKNVVLFCSGPNVSTGGALVTPFPGPLCWEPADALSGKQRSTAQRGGDENLGCFLFISSWQLIAEDQDSSWMITFPTLSSLVAPAVFITTTAGVTMQLRQSWHHNESRFHLTMLSDQWNQGWGAVSECKTEMICHPSCVLIHNMRKVSLPYHLLTYTDPHVTSGPLRGVLHILHGRHHVKSHVADVDSMELSDYRSPWYDHVCITNGFYLKEE